MNTSTQQIALITGGSRGLGRETALNLAQRGVDVIFTYQNNAAAAAEVVEQVEAQGRRAIALNWIPASAIASRPLPSHCVTPCLNLVLTVWISWSTTLVVRTMRRSPKPPEMIWIRCIGCISKASLCSPRRCCR